MRRHPTTRLEAAASLAPLLVAVLLLGGCTSASGESPATDASSVTTATLPPAATTSTTEALPTTTVPPAPTTTTAPESFVELVLHPTEQLAVRGGPAIAVSIAGTSVGALTADAPSVAVAVTGETMVDFTYVGPGGELTDVAWTQRVGPADEILEVIQPWRRPDRDAQWHVLAWSRPADREDAVAHMTGTEAITVLSPIWWFVDAEGGLQGQTDGDLVRFAHDRGVAVWPAIQGIDADALHLLLSDPVHRADVAGRIAAAAEAVGADGVNIDLEGFRDEDAAGMTAFIEEVAAAVHGWDGVVSYDLVPRSDTWRVTPLELSYWSDAPERGRIAAAVDYTILMAYDQHNRFRPAGPVAAPNWVEEMLIYQLRYSDPQDVILGVPAYGRLWDPDELDAPRALSLAALPGTDGERSPDPEFGVDRVDRADGRFYWAEADVTAVRMEFAVAYGLSGVAAWRLGLDSPDLWAAVPAPPG